MFATPGAVVRLANARRFPAETLVEVSSERNGPVPSDPMLSMLTMGVPPLVGLSLTPPLNVLAPESITPGVLPEPWICKMPIPVTGPVIQMSFTVRIVTVPLPRLNVLLMAPPEVLPSKFVV